MKTCPACGRRYEDDTLVFCLQDGSRLSSTSDVDPNATLHIPAAGPTQPGPTAFSPRATPAQSTITGRPEQFHFPARQTTSESADERPRRSPLPWILAIVLVIGVFGVLIAWIVTRGSADDVGSNYPSPLPSPSATAASSPLTTPESDETSTVNPTPRATPTRDDKPPPTPMPTPTRPKPMFAVLNNISFNGSRITYYPRQSFGQCQADCAANAGCRGFTWIKPGAYNPGDSAMCYLMSAVTARVPHACCISGVRN
jgi:hypothetical protein